jgi:hypothetical protein
LRVIFLVCRKPGYEYTDPGSGKVYYVDPDTKETSWEMPDSLKWTAVEDIEGAALCSRVVTGMWWHGREQVVNNARSATSFMGCSCVVPMMCPCMATRPSITINIVCLRSQNNVLP